tara:strand:- start:1423 stop:1554 length:132 start_codon:yes stop_codon:yes gene_type:complete
VYTYKCFSGARFTNGSQIIENGVLLATNKQFCPMYREDSDDAS